MNWKALAAALVILIVVSGCINESLPESRAKALELAKTDPQFSLFLENFPYAEIMVQRLEKEESGLFDTAPVLETAEKECGTSFPERFYWHVKAKSSQREIDVIVNNEITEILCSFETKGCQQDTECNDGQGCTKDSCNLTTSECENQVITYCEHGDYCCPAGCNSNTDSDCGGGTVPPTPGPGPTPVPTPTPDNNVEELELCSSEWLTTTRYTNEAGERLVALDSESLALLREDIATEGKMGLFKTYSLDCLQSLNLSYSGDLAWTGNLGIWENMVNLDLSGNLISDVTFIGKMTKLKYLRLNKNPINNVSALASLKNLELLELSETSLSNTEPLMGLANLKILNIIDTPISDEKCMQLSEYHLKTTEIYCGTSDSPIIYTGLCDNDKDCDDGDSCTQDSCSGSPPNCNNYRIVDCVAQDECTTAQDCDDGDPTTTEFCDGTPKTCFHIDIEVCGPENNYCPVGCTGQEDNDCCALNVIGSGCDNQCTPENDYDCCLEANMCMLNVEGLGYNCYANKEKHPTNSTKICDVSKSNIIWSDYGKPDLLITDVIFSPAEMFAGQDVDVVVQVANVGQERSGSFHIYSVTSICGTPNAVLVNALDPNQAVNVNYGTINCPIYDNQLKWTIKSDYYNAVSESNENNNNYVVVFPMKDSTSSGTYSEGDSIIGIAGKNQFEGQEMTIKLAAFAPSGQSSYVVRFELYDHTGSLIDMQSGTDGDYLEQHFMDIDGNFAIKDSVFVETVGVEPETSRGYADITIEKYVE